MISLKLHSNLAKVLYLQLLIQRHILDLSLLNDPSTIVQVWDPKTALGEEGGSETSSKKRAPGPKKEHHMPRYPELDGERERKCVILLFLSLSPSSSPSVSLLVLPHSGVFSLFAGSLLVPFPLSLTPLLAPPAGQYDDEEDDHGGDTAPDGQRQKEKFGERGCGDDTESNLSDRAVDIRRVLDLADVGAVVGELDLLKYDGGVTAHDVAGPLDTLPENALYRRIWFLLVVEHRLLSAWFEGSEAPGDDDGVGVDAGRTVERALETNICPVDRLHIPRCVYTHPADLQHA